MIFAKQQFLFNKIYPEELALPNSHRRNQDDKIEDDKIEDESENNIDKKGSMWGRNGKIWPIITTGAGLFSDGYVNNSMGAVNTCLRHIYGNKYTNSSYSRNVSSIVFAGTVLGMIIFGIVADYHSRKSGMIISSSILIVFTILCAGAWGPGGTTDSILTALIIFRFLVGIGIGGEYPAGSVACSEASASMSSGSRNRWFIFFTGFMIDFGFVIAALVPYIILSIVKVDNLTLVWRLTVGLGAIPPLSLFYFRTKFKDPDAFRQNNFKRVRTPYVLTLRYYGPRLFVISLIWFLYNFVSFSFGIFSSAILNLVVPNEDLYKTFAWNILLTSFYLPGSLLGAIFSDWFGPRLTLSGSLLIQSIAGFLISSYYDSLIKSVAPLVVTYGIFLSLGEMGPGGNIGLLASKNSPTAIRGVFYSVASSIGKIGAFVGTQSFPLIIKAFSSTSELKGVQGPFWIASSMCIFSALIAFFFLPPVTQSSIQDEDRKFLHYLRASGFDISKIGDEGFEPTLDDDDYKINPESTGKTV